MKKNIFIAILIMFKCAVWAQSTTTYEWAKTFGTVTGSATSGVDVVSDSKNNSYWLGSFSGTVDFNPDAGVFNLTASFNSAYIVKLDSAGNFLWAKQFDCNSSFLAADLHIDTKDNMYVTGYFAGILDCDPTLGISSITSAGFQDAFLCKIDTSGALIWKKRIGSATREVGKKIGTDTLGNVILTGEFINTVDFDPGIGTYNLSSTIIGTSAAIDTYILKLNSFGDFVWAGSTYAAVDAISVEKCGNIVLTGLTKGVVDIDPRLSVVNNIGIMNSQIAFFLKLDSAGALVWSRLLDGGAFSVYPNALVCANSGDIYVSGSFASVPDFDPGVGTYTINVSCGSLNLFVLKLDGMGNFLWVKKNDWTGWGTGGGGNVEGYSLCLDTLDNVYVAGTYQGVIDFDPSIGIFNLDNYYSGSRFILALNKYGDFIWVKSFGSGTQINIDSKRNLYVAGIFYGVGDFDPGAGVYNLTSVSAGNNSLLYKLGPCNATPVNAVDITAATNKVVCQNNSTILSATSAGNNYWFMAPVGGTILMAGNTYTTPVLSSVGIREYYVEVNTCAVSATRTAVSLTVNPLPTLTVTGTNTVCFGTSTGFIANGATTYTWNTGQTTSSISVNPTATTIYTVMGTDINGCSSTKTVSTIVDITCADVWPGDANSDGMADNLDVLELGLHYTQTGAPRAATSNNWQSYFANNWTGTITNGKNLNHSDCNGDGVIDDNDTLAIFNNYGLTHAFKPAQTNTVNPQLSIVPDQPMVVKGMWGTASVYLGDATSPINNINGIAYTVDFDNTLIEPNSIYIEYQNSFIDAGQNLHFQKSDFASGKIYSATTHTLGNNVSGFGKIATLHYQISSTLATDQTLTLGVSQVNQSDASGVISPLTSGTGTLMAIGASVGVKENLYSGNVLVSPNPTNGLLNISFGSIPQNTKIELYNSIGALVLTEAMNNKNNTINVGELSSGMYFMKVLEGNKVVAVKKVVKE